MNAISESVFDRFCAKGYHHWQDVAKSMGNLVQCARCGQTADSLMIPCPHGQGAECSLCRLTADMAVFNCEISGGHQIESTADIGPDSGSEDFYCTRCPWSNSVCWY
jgi:bacterioferritin-associated ferredoxin